MDKPFYPEETPPPIYWPPPPGYAAYPNAPTETETPLKLTAEEKKTVYELTEKMKRSAPIRQIADDLIGGRYAGLNSLEPVERPLVRPRRSSWRERQVACWILGRARLTPDQRDSAGNTLTHVLEGRLDPAPWSVLRRAVRNALIFAAVAAEVMQPHHEDSFRWWQNFMPSLLLFLPSTLLIMMMVHHVHLSQVKAQAAVSLGRLADVNSLDALVAALRQRTLGRFRARRAGVPFQSQGPVSRGIRRRWICPAAARALPAVLAQLTPEHYGQISAATMTGLNAALDNSEENLAVAILNAFALVGDAKVLIAVEKLAAGEGRAAREERVHEAAQRAFPLISARVEAARAPHTLLRASIVPPTPAGQLLRPAQEATPIDPMQLLRASVAPGWSGTEQEIELILSILRELEQRGDLRALPYVEQIAANGEADARVQQAAQACLPVLRARAELERYAPTLPPTLPASEVAYVGRPTHD